MFCTPFAVVCPAVDVLFTKEREDSNVSFDTEDAAVENGKNNALLLYDLSGFVVIGKERCYARF